MDGANPGLDRLPSLRDWRRTMLTPSPSPSLLPQKQSWEPTGGNTVTVPVHNVVVLDDAKIAEVVNTHSAAEMQFPRQAAMFDGRQN
jgi:hypothetical protein